MVLFDPRPLFRPLGTVLVMEAVLPAIQKKTISEQRSKPIDGCAFKHALQVWISKQWRHRIMGIKRCIICSTLVACVICAGVVFLWVVDYTPLPPGLQYFPDTRRVDIGPSKPGDPQWENGYMVAIFATLNTEETVFSVGGVSRPRFTGFFGTLRMERIRELGYYYLGDEQSWIFLPIDSRIVRYEILIREIQGPEKKEGPWHVWSVASDTLQTKLTLPNVQGLDLLSNRKSEAAILEMWRVGIAH